jgi:tRNA nucleotidyltransferase (CCA-adding enzyme)
MPKAVNLAASIERQLPMQLVEFMESTALIASTLGWRLYLVGGTVRDLLLGRDNYDLDMVVEGDALALGKQMAETKKTAITLHSRFGTVKLRWQTWTIDIATARTETYTRPGALPEPKPGMLANDLFRRDFTVNAMAVELLPGRWGQLIDLYGGRQDLKAGLIRVLHDDSFTDDATRIWRAIRYEQRLNFAIEPGTLALLKRDVSRLDTISGDRIRHELESTLKEPAPEKVFYRASNLGVMTKLSPRLKGNALLAKHFQAAREYTLPETPTLPLYLAILSYSLPEHDIADLSSFLHLPKTEAQVLQETAALKSGIKLLDKPKLKNSEIFRLCTGYTPTAIEANIIAAGSSTVRKRLHLFLTKLRYVKPCITGTDLIKLGVPPGPKVKEILQKLRDALLDGKIRSKKGEDKLAIDLIA